MHPDDCGDFKFGARCDQIVLQSEQNSMRRHHEYVPTPLVPRSALFAEADNDKGSACTTGCSVHTRQEAHSECVRALCGQGSRYSHWDPQVPYHAGGSVVPALFAAPAPLHTLPNDKERGGAGIVDVAPLEGSVCRRCGLHPVAGEQDAKERGS